jgi:hypothetical protein
MLSVGAHDRPQLDGRWRLRPQGVHAFVTAGRPGDDETIDPSVKNTMTAIGVTTTPSVRRAMRSLVLRRKGPPIDSTRVQPGAGAGEADGALAVAGGLV